jgi:thiamine transporter
MFQKVFDFLVVKVTESGETSYYPTTAGNITLIAVILLLFIAMMAASGSGKKKINAKQLAFSAVAMTLAVVTSIYTLINFRLGVRSHYSECSFSASSDICMGLRLEY